MKTVLASVLLAASGIIHAVAFRKALLVLAEAHLPRFYENSLKGLWLADSTTLIGVAVILALVAARPASATRPVVVLLAMIPAATTVLVYVFVGAFFAPHLLLGISALIVIAGLQFPDRWPADGAR